MLHGEQREAGSGGSEQAGVSSGKANCPGQAQWSVPRGRQNKAIIQSHTTDDRGQVGIRVGPYMAPFGCSWLGVWPGSRFLRLTLVCFPKARAVEKRVQQMVPRRGVPPTSARHLQEASRHHPHVRFEGHGKDRKAWRNSPKKSPTVWTEQF